MSMLRLPDEPQKRRIIFILSPYEYERLQYERSGNPLLLDAINGKVYILVPSKVDQQNPIIETLIQKQLDSVGSFLMQNPHDFSDYENINTASSIFTLSKWFHFVTFCDYLGVKNVSIEQVEILSLSSQSVYKGDVNIPVGKTDAEVKRTLDNINKTSIRINRVLPDNERDGEEATKYFKQHLASDPLVKSLLNLRPKGSYELEFNLTQEVKRSLDIAASLKMPEFPGNNIYANVQLDISKVMKESREFKLGIKIQF